MNTPALASEIVSKIRNSLQDSAHNQATMVGNMIREKLIEPKTGREAGVWFEDQSCWMYRGTLPVVMQFGPKTPEHVGGQMVISRCPGCEMGRLKAQHGTVRRWLILPP